jgi:hypothetical protein
LAKVGQLHPHEARADEIGRLLSAAERNLKDAGRRENSAETRFDCAYKAIMQCAMIALMAAGYRTASNAPGHHQTVIQSATRATTWGSRFRRRKSMRRSATRTSCWAQFGLT